MTLAKNNNLITELSFENICKTYNLSKPVAEILTKRGYNTKEKLNSFLFDNISNLKDPFLLLNMKEVVERIEKAISLNEKILIFGDYDVDGICATSILYNYLKTKTNNVFTYLPNRFEDGYGLSCPAIDKIAKKEKPNLIITVDCGISCVKEVEFVKQMGIDIIVTDHHVIPSEIPNCLIINTKFMQEFNFDGLCGAGVAFKIVQALCFLHKENFEPYIALASIATIADIVPLCDENRIIVKEGLKRLDLLPMGVKILLKNTFKTLKEISSNDIAFKIAPKINSAGRLDDANVALKLFVSDDLKEINKSLKQLEFLNNKRKSLCEKIFEEAKQMAGKMFGNKIIILFKKNWDIGVLGIVCAKMCEEFNLPVLLLAENAGVLKGSMRTVGNIDAVKIFENSKELLVNFGGHQKAGGVSILEKDLKEFIKKSNEFLRKTYVQKDFETEKTFDLEIDEKEISTDFVKQLDIFQPCGYANQTPVFKTSLHATKVSKLKNMGHLLIKTNYAEYISFNNEKSYENYSNFDKKVVLCEFSINKFKNKESVKGIIKSSKFFEPGGALNLKLEANYFEQLCFQDVDFKPKYYTSLKQIENLFDKKTAFICYDIAKKFDENKFDFSSFFANGFENANVIFGLKNINELKKFDKIIFCEKPLTMGFAKQIAKVSNAVVYVPINSNFVVKPIVGREVFLNVYYALIKAINKNIFAQSEYEYFELMQLNFKPNFNFLTFFLALMVFKELKLIDEVHNDCDKIGYKLNKIKTDLENSSIFQKLKNFGD